MSPRTREQWEPIKARRRARMLESALRLFATRGVEMTSMDEVARRSGVSKGLIYTYFKNKEALLGAVIAEGLHSLQRLLPEDGEIETNPRGAVATMVRSTFGSMRSQKAFWSLYLSLVTHPGVIRRHRATFLQAAEQFRRVAARGVSSMPQERADLRGLLLLATLDGVMLHYLLAGEAYPLEEIRDHILREWADQQEES